MGWRRDTPDFRDYTTEHSAVRELLAPLRPADSPHPAKVDLREYFLAVEDQQSRHCSTACACLALVEYFQGRAAGHAQRASRCFLYSTTRRMMGVGGDVAADLRTTLKALVRFGVPPETYWPPDQCGHKDPMFDPLLYGFAADYRSIRYVRLDPPNISGFDTLEWVKAYLAAGFPAVFGFAIPSSVNSSAHVPYRPTLDSIVGGQAVVAVGYDDEKRAATKGALMIRNSWGTAWGENGYGWLPYRFVEKQLAVDFWTLLDPRWLASGEFTCPAIPARPVALPTSVVHT
jgi:C1A family cysteine protease